MLSSHRPWGSDLQPPEPVVLVLLCSPPRCHPSSLCLPSLHTPLLPSSLRVGLGPQSPGFGQEVDKAWRG